MQWMQLQYIINARRACARGLQYPVCLSVCVLPVSCFLFTFIRQIIPTCLFFARFSRFATIRIWWNGFFREIERFSRLSCSFQSRWTVPYTTCGYNGHVECHTRSTISANSANSIGHEWRCHSACWCQTQETSRCIVIDRAVHSKKAWVSL